MQSPLRERREPPGSKPETAFDPESHGSGTQKLFGRFFRVFGSKPPARTVEPGANALLAFRSEASEDPEPASIAETAVRPAVRPADPPSRRFVRPLLIVVALAVVAGLTILAIRRFPIPSLIAPAPRLGSLTVDARPGPAEVLIDGEARGSTPLKLSLAPGAHTITVRAGGDERVVPLTISAGADITQYFEMKAVEPAALVGRVSVSTEPPGARVAVDGQQRGTSPITIADLTADKHTVTVTSATGSAERTVIVPAGGTASVVFSLPAVAGPVGGWLSISAPFDVEIVENQDVIGTSASSQVMLAAGRHNITLRNLGLGYQEPRRVDVIPGKTTAIRVEAPKASVSVNARPWADVTLDGSSVGQTPIANLLVTVGSHEIVFKHPEFGERKQTVVVTAKGPNRTAVDFTK